MPVRSSGYYNNPQFAQAASNIASLFEPPSGADAAGWASANAKKAEAQRLQDFFDYQKNPDFDQGQFDRMGVAAGAYQPNQSYYSVDQGNATTMRGQDVTAATSRANNGADNARALEANRLGELGKFYQPLNEGQVRPELPADIAGQFGVGHELPAAQGREKALTEGEVQGGLVQQMRDAGLITDQNVVDRYVGDKTPVEAVGPDGKPTYMAPGQAVRTGAAPYDAPKGNGTTMTLADGTVVQIGGDKPLTEAQGKLVNYGTTAKSMLPVLDSLGAELTSLPQDLSTLAPRSYGGYAQSPEYQKARIAGERFTQSILRNESGAATPDAEIQHYNETFLPVPGDKPETIRMKSWLRNVAVNALEGGMTLQARKAAVDAAIASGPPPDFQPGASAAPPAPAAQPAPTGGPQPGTVEGGYKFKGGNPSDPASWEPVQ